jgi:hypothetical protein
VVNIAVPRQDGGKFREQHRPGSVLKVQQKGRSW